MPFISIDGNDEDIRYSLVVKFAKRRSHITEQVKLKWITKSLSVALVFNNFTLYGKCISPFASSSFSPPLHIKCIYSRHIDSHYVTIVSARNGMVIRSTRFCLLCLLSNIFLVFSIWFVHQFDCEKWLWHRSYYYYYDYLIHFSIEYFESVFGLGRSILSFRIITALLSFESIAWLNFWHNVLERRQRAQLIASTKCWKLIIFIEAI